MADYMSFASQMAGDDGFRRAEKAVDDRFARQATLTAGRQYAGGDQAGAAATLAQNGNIDGARAIQGDIQQGQQQDQQALAAKAKRNGEFLLQVTDALSQIKGATPEETVAARQAQLATIRPALAQIMPPEVVDQIQGADLSDQSLGAFRTALGGEMEKFQFINQGDDGGIYRGSTRSGEVSQVVAPTAVPKPVNVPNGGTLVDPATGKVLYSSPKTYAPRQSAGGGGASAPPGPPAAALGAPTGTGPKDVSAEWGQGAKQLPDGSIVRIGPRGGTTVLKQSTGPKPLPQAIQIKLIENRSSLSQIDQAIAEVDKNPKALGLQNWAPDAVTQRLDPRGVAARGAVANIGSQIIHDRSGANVTISESPRLKPFIPSATDSATVAKQKLAGLRRQIETMNREIEAAYGQGGQPYSGPPKAAAPAAQSPSKPVKQMSNDDLLRAAGLK